MLSVLLAAKAAFFLRLARDLSGILGTYNFCYMRTDTRLGYLWDLVRQIISAILTARVTLCKLRSCLYRWVLVPRFIGGDPHSTYHVVHIAELSLFLLNLASGSRRWHVNSFC